MWQAGIRVTGGCLPSSLQYSYCLLLTSTTTDCQLGNQAGQYSAFNTLQSCQLTRLMAKLDWNRPSLYDALNSISVYCCSQWPDSMCCNFNEGLRWRWFVVCVCDVLRLSWADDATLTPTSSRLFGARVWTSLSALSSHLLGKYFCNLSCERQQHCKSKNVCDIASSCCTMISFSLFLQTQFKHIWFPTSSGKHSLSNVSHSSEREVQTLWSITVWSTCEYHVVGRSFQSRSSVQQTFLIQST